MPREPRWSTLRYRVGSDDSEAFRCLRDNIAKLDPVARAELAEPTFELASELGRDFVRATVAHDGARDVAGFLIATEVADELHVVDVLVLPEFRGRGVGRELVRVALEDAAERGLRVALLEVRRTNRAARALYAAMGFVVVNVRRRYYADTGEDAVEMACAITPGALEPFGTPLVLDESDDERRLAGNR
jgi:ribosomal-protein-alanine N-acetyltransferase